MSRLHRNPKYPGTGPMAIRNLLREREEEGQASKIKVPSRLKPASAIKDLHFHKLEWDGIAFIHRRHEANRRIKEAFRRGQKSKE